MRKRRRCCRWAFATPATSTWMTRGLATRAKTVTARISAMNNSPTSRAPTARVGSTFCRCCVPGMKTTCGAMRRWPTCSSRSCPKGATRRLADDWEPRYGIRPVLLETFAERPRFHGTCYQAANWIYLGDTKGRGKLDVHNQSPSPKKAIWVYPLNKHFRNILCR